MKELLISLAAGLVENPDAVEVKVDEPNSEGVTVYHLHVAESDMGRVIGKQGSKFSFCIAEKLLVFPEGIVGIKENVGVFAFQIDHAKRLIVVLNTFIQLLPSLPPRLYPSRPRVQEPQGVLSALLK